MNLADFRPSLDHWLDENADELAPEHAHRGTLDQQMAQLSKVKRLAFDAGWMRWGWPERVGGLGGSPLLRGYLRLGAEIGGAPALDPAFGVADLLVLLDHTAIDPRWRRYLLGEDAA